jgi:hypothetical protein
VLQFALQRHLFDTPDAELTHGVRLRHQPPPSHGASLTVTMEGVLAAVAKAYSGTHTVSDPAVAIAAAVRSCNALPLASAAAHDANRFYVERSYPAFAPRVAAQQRRIESLLSRVVELVEPGVARAVVDGLTSSEPDVAELSEFLDRLRESAEACIDEARGQHSSQQAEAVQNRLLAAAETVDSRGRRAMGGHASPKRPPSAMAMDKPQLSFPDAINNSRGAPAVPRLPEPCFREPGAPPPTPGIHPYAGPLAALAVPVEQVRA